MKFGLDPKCLNMSRTHSAKFKCLEVKRRFLSSIRGFDVIYGISGLWICLDKVLGLVGLVGQNPGGLG